MDAVARRRLRRELAERAPQLTDPDLGPSAVEAGECDRCGAEPRVLSTCGPVRWGALGRRCAAEVGLAAWCDGHRQDGRRLLDRLPTLPPDRVIRMWWVATGEVRIDPGH